MLRSKIRAGMRVRVLDPSTGEPLIIGVVVRVPESPDEEIPIAYDEGACTTSPPTDLAPFRPAGSCLKSYGHAQSLTSGTAALVFPEEQTSRRQDFLEANRGRRVTVYYVVEDA